MGNNFPWQHSVATGSCLLLKGEEPLAKLPAGAVETQPSSAETLPKEEDAVPECPILAFLVGFK